MELAGHHTQLVDRRSCTQAILIMLQNENMTKSTCAIQKEHLMRQSPIVSPKCPRQKQPIVVLESDNRC